MEDYTPILWILLIGASLLFPALTKGAKAAREAQKQMPEAWPPHSSDDDETESPRGSNPDTYRGAGSDTYTPTTETQPGPKTDGRRSPSTTKQDSQTYKSGSLAEEMAAYKQYLQPDPLSARREAERYKPATAQEVSTRSESSSGIAEEFDLRKAVIYSEILKPKFDE